MPAKVLTPGSDSETSAVDRFSLELAEDRVHDIVLHAIRDVLVKTETIFGAADEASRGLADALTESVGRMAIDRPESSLCALGVRGGSLHS